MSTEPTATPSASVPRRWGRSVGSILVWILVLPWVSTSVRAQSPEPDRNPVYQELLVARQTFYDAVEEKDKIGLAEDRFEGIIEARPSLAVRANAYLGSLKGLRAKHSVMPWSRIVWVRRCLSQLDAALKQAPDDLEVVFLHAVICHNLPFFFGRRDDSVADFRRLIELLPEHHTDYDLRILNDIFNNIIERSRLSEEEIARARQLRVDLGYPKLKRERQGTDARNPKSGPGTTFMCPSS